MAISTSSVKIFCASLVLSIAGASVDAATVIISETIDASAELSNQTQVMSQSYTIQTGDHVTLDFQFLLNKSLRIDIGADNYYLGLRLQKDQSGLFTITDINVIFRDFFTDSLADGTVSIAQETDSEAHFGPQVFGTHSMAVLWAAGSKSSSLAIQQLSRSTRSIHHLSHSIKLGSSPIRSLNVLSAQRTESDLAVAGLVVGYGLQSRPFEGRRRKMGLGPASNFGAKALLVAQG